MKLRVPSRRLLVLALGWVVLIACTIPGAGAASLPAAAPNAPQSCKPRPPLQITLEPGSAPGTWRVRTEALAPAAQVVLVLRDDAGGSQIVWRGALAQDEVREFDVRYAVRTRATRLTAEATLQNTPTAIVRGIATIVVAGGKAVAGTAPLNGRMIPAGGGSEAVLELPGEIGGRR